MITHIHTMMVALAVLVCWLIGCDGLTESHRDLAETSAPSLSAVPSLSPSLLSLTPSFSPSADPSSSPSVAPSLSPAPTSLAPTFPPVEMGTFEWDLERIGSGIFRFSEESDMSEIVLQYNTSLRDFTVELFETDCVTSIPSTIATASGITSQHSLRHSTLTVSIDIAQDNVTSYPGVWTDVTLGEGLITMCVRVDLMRNVGGEVTSVTFHEQRLRVTVGLLQGFDVEFVDVSRETPDVEDGDVDVDYELTACQCDESFKCLASVLKPGSSVYLCLMSAAANVEIVGIDALTFSQGSMSVRSVVNGTEDPFTSVAFIDKKALIRHQTRSFFFDMVDPDNVVAEGFALIGFTNGNGRRRLLRTNIKNRALETMTDADEMPFNIPLAVESSLRPFDSGASRAHLISALTIAMGGFAFVLAY